MSEQDLFGAFPLLLRCRDFGSLQLPAPKVRKSVDDDPGNAAAKVDNLGVEVESNPGAETTGLDTPRAVKSSSSPLQ